MRPVRLKDLSQPDINRIKQRAENAAASQSK